MGRKARRKAKRKKAAAPELPFLDLPLNPPAGSEPDPEASAAAADKEPPPAEPQAAKPIPPRQTALFGGGPSGRMLGEPEEAKDVADEAEPDEAELEAGLDEEVRPAALHERLRAGLADLTVQLMMLAVAVTAAFRLGVSVTLDYWPPFAILALDYWPPFAILALVFSFLYWVVPLAFWGQTPGMAWVGHLARATDGEPLIFRQSVMRWLGALLTAALAGLPLLLALAGGRSLSDRLSDSKTLGI